MAVFTNSDAQFSISSSTSLNSPPRGRLQKSFAPKIKELISVIGCVGIYHNISTVKNIILNTSLHQTIVKCLPSESNIIYLEKHDDHTSQNPMNLKPVSIFYFNARFVTKIESGFKANQSTLIMLYPP